MEDISVAVTGGFVPEQSLLFPLLLEKNQEMTISCKVLSSIGLERESSSPRSAKKKNFFKKVADDELKTPAKTYCVRLIIEEKWQSKWPTNSHLVKIISNTIIR